MSKITNLIDAVSAIGREPPTNADEIEIVATMARVLLCRTVPALSDEAFKRLIVQIWTNDRPWMDGSGVDRVVQ